LIFLLLLPRVRPTKTFVRPKARRGSHKVSEIARRLGVSQRTFARRLSSEGLTFSGVLESLRSSLAERYLTDADLSISQIARLLGYQEVSAFTHAVGPGLHPERLVLLPLHNSANSGSGHE
jgi:AraC-like DNA-binding protein